MYVKRGGVPSIVTLWPTAGYRLSTCITFKLQLLRLRLFPPHSTVGQVQFTLNATLCPPTTHSAADQRVYGDVETGAQYEGIVPGLGIGVGTSSITEYNR